MIFIDKLQSLLSEWFLCDNVDSYIVHIEGIMSWISVDDALPKANNYFSMFIVYTDNGVGVARYDGGFRDVKIEGNVQYSSNNVTHWMPMPSKPISI